MEKGFLIKNSDINDLMWAYKENLSELLKSFAVLRTSIQMLVGDGNFAGKGANSVKKYYLDVHGTAIELFETLAQWMLDTVLPYKVGYNMIDKKEGFILPEESMRKFKDLLQSCLSDTEDSAQIADTAIQSVSDILGLTPPSLEQIEEAHSSIDQNVESKMTEIEEYEETTACGITKLESFLDTIRSCVAEIESGQFQIIGYSAGAFLSRPEVVQGLGVIKKRREFQRDNKELLDQIWADEAELKRLSDERKEEGVWKTIGGVTLVVVGIVCIAASAGAATPVFIVAAAAGSGTVAFGVADSFEGAQEIYYGSVKDIETKSVNILRDSLFNGNQEAYNIVESIFAYTAAAMTPMGTMSSAGTLTLRSGATTVGKLFISDAAGYATSHYVYELTGNRTLSMISGMGGSFVAGFGLNRIDARFSISNGHAVPGEMPVKLNEVSYEEIQIPVEGGSENVFSPINPGPLDINDANSFRSATYKRIVLTEDTTFYRVYSSESNRIGPYMTRTPQNGAMQSQFDLALNPDWGNNAAYVEKVVVPKGTTIYEGVAAPQTINGGAGKLLGGGNQVFINRKELDASWFNH